jgi:hypothetical protein
MLFFNGRYNPCNEKTTAQKVLHHIPIVAASFTAAAISTAAVKNNHTDDFEFAIRYAMNFFADLLYTTTYILSRESIRSGGNECETCETSEAPVTALANTALDALINVFLPSYFASLTSDAIAYFIMHAVEIVIVSLLLGSIGGLFAEILAYNLLFVLFNYLLCSGAKQTNHSVIINNDDATITEVDLEVREKDKDAMPTDDEERMPITVSSFGHYGLIN